MRRGLSIVLAVAAFSFVVGGGMLMQAIRRRHNDAAPPVGIMSAVEAALTDTKPDQLSRMERSVGSSMTNVLLPPIQQVPSPKWPFVFFHLRKTGGSALRPIVAQAADALNLTFFVPCLEKLARNSINQIGLPSRNHKASCNQYYLGALLGRDHINGTSIFAGHFFWDATALQAPSVIRGAAVVPGASPRPPSCFIMFRDPVARFYSCYKERFMKSIGKPLNDLTSRQLNDVLANYTEINDVRQGVSLSQGCNNEIARWISPDMGWGDDHVNRGELSEKALNETKRRISLCTIGDVTARTNDTLRVVKHWHPWLASRYKANNLGHRSVGTHVPLVELPLRAIQAIRRANALDLELYAFAMARFELLVQHLPEG